jgi:hypothetical protein
MELIASLGYQKTMDQEFFLNNLTLLLLLSSVMGPTTGIMLPELDGTTKLK